jgi:phosphoribosylformylglycinamidine cyclo-ligase
MFGWLAKSAGIAESEMLRTFNCGIGLCVIAAPEKVDGIVAAFAAHGQNAARIGTLIAGQGEARVTYKGALKL